MGSFHFFFIIAVRIAHVSDVVQESTVLSAASRLLATQAGAFEVGGADQT
jgi:hypothetical protein